MFFIISFVLQETEYKSKHFLNDPLPHKSVLYTNDSIQSSNVYQEIVPVSWRVLWAELKLHTYKILPDLSIQKLYINYYLLVRGHCFLSRDR